MILNHIGQDIPSPGIFPFTIRFNHNLVRKSGKTVITWGDNVADEINQDRDNEVQGRRYPQRDRQPTQRYGQNIYE